jgi:hypothetical protein
MPGTARRPEISTCSACSVRIRIVRGDDLRRPRQIAWAAPDEKRSSAPLCFAAGRLAAVASPLPRVARSGPPPDVAGRLGALLKVRLHIQVAHVEADGGGTVGTG